MPLLIEISNDLVVEMDAEAQRAVPFKTGLKGFVAG
jgi:hypothetical protein